MTRPPVARAGLLLALLLCVSCGSDDPQAPPDPGPDWDYGPAVTHDVDLGPGGTVDEPVSGGVIVFPEGGEGVLTVREILSGPEVPLPGVGLLVEYDGDEPLRLRPADPGGETLVLGWGVASGSFSGADAAAERWISLARDPDAAAPEFPLCPPFDLAAKRTNRRGYTQHHITNIPAGSTDAVRLAAVRAQAATDIQSWLDVVPAALYFDVAARVDNLPPAHYADDDYYIGFAEFSWGDVTWPMMGLRPGSLGGTVAHEVGHYMHHMIIGDELYGRCERLAPDVHGVGDFHAGRPTIGEDVAYFSQFLLRGDLNNLDPTEPASLFRSRNPRVHDFPALEGLACCLLARLWSADATIGSLTDVDDRRPVPTARLGMSEIVGILAQGALTIDELLADVTTYLIGVGKADVLPVLLERIGWRYMFKVRLVDQDGQPLRNVRVEKRAVSNLTAYHPNTRYAVTDDDGWLVDDYGFPLDSELRLEHLGQEYDLPIRIDPALPTDQRVDLGTITVGNALDLRLAQYLNVEVRVYGSWDDAGGIHDDWWTASTRGSLPGTLAGNVFTASDTYDAYGYRFVINASVTVDPADGSVTAYELVSHATSNASDDLEHVEARGGGVPLNVYEHGEDSVFYQAWINQTPTCGAIDELERTTVYGGTPGSLTGWACEGPGGVAQIRIRLSSQPLAGRRDLENP